MYLLMKRNCVYQVYLELQLDYANNETHLEKNEFEGFLRRFTHAVYMVGRMLARWMAGSWGYFLFGMPVI